MPIEKGGEKRGDPPRAVRHRQRDTQQPGWPVNVARGVLGVLDGGESVPGTREQRIAGVSASATARSATGRTSATDTSARRSPWIAFKIRSGLLAALILAF